VTFAQSVKLINKTKIKEVGVMCKIVLLIMLIFCFVAVSYAAPCYGTKLPQKQELFAGLQVHSILQRNLEDGYGKLRSRQYFFLLSYGIFDWLSLDLKGGAGNIKQRPDIGNEMDYATYLGGGYGFRIKFYNHEKTKMVFGFQHISIHPHTISIGASKHKAVLDDWQFSFLASCDFRKFTPYIGTKWSRLDYIHWVDRNRKRVKSDLAKSIGLIAGVDLPLNDKAWFNLEGQFLDGETIAGSLNFKF
jgi:hypothetical protein